MTTPSFLSSCTSGGCGAKIGPDALAGLLGALPAAADPNLLVGFDASDDAAVYRLDETHSLISTADFFSPMVEDARVFGRIAAANALSDVWAMGGRPLVALNLVCFPEKMDTALLAEMLQGGAEKIREAGAVLGGGHSIYDKEPKYGLAVTGIVETARLLRNNTPQPGHRLLLTKPLGTGILLAAARGGVAGPKTVKRATEVMERLNRYAAEAMARHTVSACTDVTGFGLLAHALEMAGRDATLEVWCGALPLLREAVAYADAFLLTAAGQRNRNHVSKRCDVSGLPFATQELLFDPQTSGGLLLCVAESEAEALLEAIRRGGDEEAALIGRVLPRGEGPIRFA